MVILIVVLSLLLLLGVPILIENRDAVAARIFGPRHSMHDDVPMPFLILPLAPSDHDGREPMPPAPIAAAESTSRWAPPPARTVTFVERDEMGAGSKSVVEGVHDGAHSPSVDAMDEVPTDATVVFRRTGDEAMQLLPGRLRVVAGDGTREEIRLFGLIGEPASITVGREAGPAYRVVTLKSPTVSRRHARLDFEDGGWVIRNLSRTNPIVVNEQTLDDAQATRRLADGDRIELGDVVLQFVE